MKPGELSVGLWMDDQSTIVREPVTTALVVGKTQDPVPCTFSAATRLVAARGMLTYFDHNLGFAYDGVTLYVRVVGIGKHVTTPSNQPTRRKVARYYFRLQSNGLFYVFDRNLKAKTGSSLYAKVATRALAQSTMLALKERNDAAYQAERGARAKRQKRTRRAGSA